MSYIHNIVCYQLIWILRKNKKKIFTSHNKTKNFPFPKTSFISLSLTSYCINSIKSRRKERKSFFFFCCVFFLFFSSFLHLVVLRHNKVINPHLSNSSLSLDLTAKNSVGWKKKIHKILYLSSKLILFTKLFYPWAEHSLSIFSFSFFTLSNNQKGI